VRYVLIRCEQGARCADNFLHARVRVVTKPALDLGDGGEPFVRQLLTVEQNAHLEQRCGRFRADRRLMRARETISGVTVAVERLVGAPCVGKYLRSLTGRPGCPLSRRLGAGIRESGRYLLIQAERLVEVAGIAQQACLVEQG
jgi:hypothetical protein